MPIEISLSNISRLENGMAEIRCRALDTVESKLRDARSNLDDLTVNVGELLKSLMKLLRNNPLTDEHRILNILLIILQSKFRSEARKILKNKKYQSDFNWLQSNWNEMAPPSKECLNEILDILNANDEEDRQENGRLDASSARHMNLVNEKEVTDADTRAHCFAFTNAWETPLASDLNTLKLLKQSLQADVDRANHEHALLYFDVIVNDYPGEYFLQSPYIFASLVHLLEADDAKVNKGHLLNCCLQLTKNLERRVTVRRLSKTYYSKPASAAATPPKQVTIGTYCYEIFRAALGYLQEIYNTNQLENVNLCTIVLIEVIELICATAVAYSTAVAIDYRIDKILHSLGDFLKFIRESSDNYSRNPHKINRNNSISVIYLVCRLLMFKDNGAAGSEMENICSKMKNDFILSGGPKEYDAKMFASSFNRSHEMATGASIDQTNTDSFVSALNETIDDAHRSQSKAIWIRELEIALLDFALKDFYPDVHELIAIALKLNEYKSTNQIKVLLNISGSFRAAIKLLKEPKMCTDEMYVREGLDTIDVLPVLQCDELVQNVFSAISNLSAQYDTNEPLKAMAESLLLRLFGHECMQLKQLVYRLTAQKMSQHFSCIMDGTTMIAKSYSARIGRCNLFGLPLTAEILIEIICGGLTAGTDSRVYSHAETILTLILRSREVMPQYWNTICEFLVPTLPLLLCFATKKTKLGQLILELSEPDNDDRLPTLRMFQSNVVLLFSRETSNREEAIYRMSFLLQTNARAADYLPNINYLNDVIPNNLCVVEAFVNPEWNNFTDLYEASYVQPMIDLLNASDVEPSIRHTTLIQLNVMLQDISVVQHFYNAHGMRIVLRIFDESLRNEPSDVSYADNVIPIVGILAKLCMRLASVRHRLATDLPVYILLLRAQLLFLDNVTFKTDCAIVLFSMAFSEYIVGGSGGGGGGGGGGTGGGNESSYNNSAGNDKQTAQLVSIPAICKRLLVPLKCDYHRLQSISEARSALEMLLLTSSDGAPLSCPSSSSATINCIETAYDRNVYWRFVRMCFASAWFGSLNDLDECTDKSSTIAVNYSQGNGRKLPIAFNKKLCLTRNDVEVINGTSPMNGINHWLQQLRNATTCEQVSMSCAAIENYSNVDSVNRKRWDANTFLNAIRRFCTIMPHGESEYLVYRQVQRLLSNLVERDFRDVHIWILREFQQNNCVFLQMLSSSSPATPQIFASNVQFLEVVLSKTFQLQAKKSIDYLLRASADATQKNASKAPNLYEKLFTMTTSQLDDTFSDRNIDKLRSLLSLLRLITSSVHVTVDDYTASHLVNKLLKFIKAFTPYAQTGSQFNKNCLLTIGNLMIKIDQLKIESKYVKLLSGLCSHRDYEVRAYAWSILTKLSTTLIGAEQMIHELSNLPGGFHACCLSTLLDTTEPAIVRENSAYVFSTLISYRKENGQLHDRVLPMCWDNGEPVRNQNHLDILLKQHSLFSQIVSSLEHFHAGETIRGHDAFSGPLTSCDLLRSFCVIMCNLLTLRAVPYVDVIYLTIPKMITIIPQVTKAINKSSVLLLTEICTFIVHCMHQQRPLIDRVAQEKHIVSAFISVLNIELFETIPRSMKHECWSEVLTVLKWLSRSSIGFQAICESFEQNNEHLSDTFNIFAHGLTSKDMRTPVLRILTNLLVVSQSDEFKFKTFADCLNGLEINEDVELSANRLVTDGKINSQSIVNLIAESNDEEERFAIDILYRLLVGLFVQPPARTELKLHENVCKTLEALLKCSARSRNIASDEKFMLQIIDQMEKVADSIGGSWADYVRRYGSTKTEKYAAKMRLLFNMVISWYSCDCLEDIECVQSMVQTCIRLWPCLAINFDTQSRFMKMLLFLSDDSLPVCKSMASITISMGGNGTQNLLHIILDYCVSETNKAKNPQANLTILELGLRVVSNCCSCIEGRILINKVNVLQTLSRLHPQVTRGQKPWSQVTFYWLRFWEILTRYADGSSAAKHLNLLRVLVEGNASHLRQLALQILRNMSFNTANRSVLLTSDDFMHVIYTVLNKGTPYEQLIIVTSIWKLIAQNFKGKNTIKNSKIFNLLRKLYEELEMATPTRTNKAADGDADAEQLVAEILDELRIALNHTMSILNA